MFGRPEPRVDALCQALGWTTGATADFRDRLRIGGPENRQHNLVCRRGQRGAKEHRRSGSGHRFGALNQAGDAGIQRLIGKRGPIPLDQEVCQRPYVDHDATLG